MAARKSARRKRASRARRPGAARKRLAPAKERRGLASGEIRLGLDDAGLAPLVAAVTEAGGAPIGAYRDPFAGRALLVAALPIEAVDPTPFQRDLSPTHAKRLAQKIEETGSFLDPLIAVRAGGGRFWTPNGRHRLAAAKVLGLRQITALISPDEDLAFRILALNTEKAHNLRDRSLEAIRMARALAQRSPGSAEASHAEVLEAPELLTLGIVYEEEGRFAGGAYAPLLKKVDRFANRGLAASLRDREGFAARIVAIDAEVKRIVAALQERGFRSPYLRSYVVARLNPVRFVKTKPGAVPPMALGAALTRMAASARKFDPASVRERDLALVAAVASGDDA
ncbi:MAG TPA: ParB/RepB/Spo0J family partition protein [Myxococcota bacterium]|nr:ParB/RepB/Spo0J family partition protein [Myxococcota bacterium]